MSLLLKNLKPTYQVMKDGTLLAEDWSRQQLNAEFRKGTFQPEDTYRRKDRSEWITFANRWKRSIRFETTLISINALLFLASGLFILHLGMFIVNWAAESRSWSSVPGKITATQIEHRGDERLEYEPEVYYRYEVNGKTYRGDQIHFGPTLGSESWAQSVIDRYPAESTRPVYYNPAHIHQSLLEPGFTPQTFQPLALGGLLIYISIALGWIACRAPFRPFPRPDLPRPTKRSILIRFALALTPVILGAILIWGIL